jgi:hypothetical protein
MRIEVPGTEQWIDLRGPDELTGADDDAWQGVYTAIWAERAESDVNEDTEGDGMEVSADGASMAPRKRRTKVPPNIVQRQRDVLLASLITGWSYSEPPFSLPLPYSTEARKTLPLAACKALDAAIKPHVEAITDSGPKETTEASGTSGNGSGAAS